MEKFKAKIKNFSPRNRTVLLEKEGGKENWYLVNEAAWEFVENLEKDEIVNVTFDEIENKIHFISTKIETEPKSQEYLYINQSQRIRMAALQVAKELLISGKLNLVGEKDPNNVLITIARDFEKYIKG